MLTAKLFRAAIEMASNSRATIFAVNDQRLPETSFSRDETGYNWLPASDTTGWIIYHFEQPEVVSQCRVLWMSDIANGGRIGLPEEWKVYYMADNKWKEVEHRFMWVSFTGPHNPWNAPGRLAEYYREMEELPDGDFIEGELKTKPLDYTRHRYGYGGNLFDYYDGLPESAKQEVRRELRSGHYGLLSFIDEQISRIIYKLEKQGVLENTIIIFTSDHGSALFDNEMLHKGAHFPVQSIVPFVVWGPGMVKPGFRDNFTSHADIYATLLDIAGVSDIRKTDGSSFFEMFSDTDAITNRFAIIESTMVTSIMTEQWLMGIHHISGESDLYNLIDDPMCHDNLALNSSYKKVIDQLKLEIVNWRRANSYGELIGDNPCSWYSELGDTAYVSDYFKGYINEYVKLTQIDKERPGVTGEKAGHILETIRNR